MKLFNNPNIFFDKVSHSYTNSDGVLLEGVTAILAKHGLSADYTGIPEKVLNEAAAKGTALHEQIENYDNGIMSLVTPLIEGYKKVCKENNLVFVANELLVSDGEIVASSIDGVYQGQSPDHFILIDYKSTLKIHWRPLSWQLSLYRYLFERQFPGAKVDALYVLHIDKKTEKILGLYPVQPIDDAEVQALLQAEKDGLIYIDENDVPAAEEILDAGEAAALAVNAAKIAELEATLKVLKAADEAVRDKLIAYMEKNNLQEISCGGGTFKLKAAYTTTRVDSKKLKEQFPAVYQKVTKDSVTKASLTYKQNQ